jgi:hypothetical protein
VGESESITVLKNGWGDISLGAIVGVCDVNSVVDWVVASVTVRAEGNGIPRVKVVEYMSQKLLPVTNVLTELPCLFTSTTSKLPETPSPSEKPPISSIIKTYTPSSKFTKVLSLVFPLLYVPPMATVSPKMVPRCILHSISSGYPSRTMSIRILAATIISPGQLDGGKEDSSQIWYSIQSMAALTREYVVGKKPLHSDPELTTPTWTPPSNSGPPLSPV